jgi:hypothetical protein
MKQRDEPTWQKGAPHNGIFEVTRTYRCLACYTLLWRNGCLQKKSALSRTNIANFAMHVHRANKNNWNTAGNT